MLMIFPIHIRYARHRFLDHSVITLAPDTSVPLYWSFDRNLLSKPKYLLLNMLVPKPANYHTGTGQHSGLEGFRQIGSFIVVCEQLIVYVQYIKMCLIVDVTSNPRHHV